MTLGAVAACVCIGTGSAWALPTGTSTDYQDVYFTGNGAAMVELFSTPGGPTTSAYNEAGFSAVDPNSGYEALTFALPEEIGEGIVDIDNSTGTALIGAIAFYNSGGFGYMTEYANEGGQLDETLTGDFVPTGSLLSGVNPTVTIDVDSSGNFIWEPGGSYRANNDYFGNITGSGFVGPDVPDAGSTLMLLSGAIAAVGALRRKLS